MAQKQLRTAIVAAILSIGISHPVAAKCLDKQMLETFLKHEHGLRLHSWGLDDTGNMLELWIGNRGHWATVTTQPDKCATVEIPHKLRGRLWTPPSPNKAIPQDRTMNKGQGL